MKIYKNKSLFSKEGGGTRRAVPGSAFVFIDNKYIFLFHSVSFFGIVFSGY